MSALLMSSFASTGSMAQVQTFGLSSTLRPPLKLFSGTPKPSMRWKVVVGFKGFPLAVITAPPEPEPGTQSPALSFACRSPSIAKPPAGVPVSGVPVGGGGQVVGESLKVADAVKPEAWPVAVKLSVVPMRSSVNTYQVVWKPPWASAVTVQGS